MERTALVTGATGFIGARLIPALQAEGWGIVASGRRSRPCTLPAEVEYRPADLAADDLAPLVAGVSHVVHLAGASSSKSDQAEMERANIVGTGRLADAALGAGVARFVHMSSTSVYGEEVQLPSPVREDVELHPSRGYGKAKAGAEEAVRTAGGQGLDVVVLRPVTVYGPGAVKLVASVILDVAVERHAGFPDVPVFSEPIEQRLLHIDDLLGATLHVLTADGVGGRAFNVASGTYPSSHDVARAVAAQFDLPVRFDDDPDCGPDHETRSAAHARMLEAGMADHILLSPQRFRFLRKSNRNNRVSIEALESSGFKVRETDLDDAIARSVAWYRAERWIL